MRIVFLARLFYPHIGGVEKHVYEISKRLIKKGHTVIVITEQYDKALPLYEKYKNILIYRVPHMQVEKKKKFVIWKWFLTHINILKKANIIHCHDVFFWYLPFRFLFPTKKVFTTFHGYEGNKTPNKRAVFMHKIAEYLSYGTICIGGFFEKWYKTKPSIVSYGAVHLPTKKEYKVTKKKAVFIGRLEEETGIMTYLQALNNMKHTKLTLDVFGDGSLREKCELYVKKHNLPVTFHGFVKDINQFIAMSQMVFVSRYLGILEAFAYKKHVFAVYNKEIKKDYLFLTPFKDYITIVGGEKKLTKSLQNFSEEKKKDEIIYAYNWVKKQTWEKMVNNYVQLWTNNKL